MVGTMVGFLLWCILFVLCWPLALVISGMMLMGVGYLTFRLKRRYLSE